MSSFNDIPPELQIEIFKFLSVKHLSKLLTINKSITDQLTHCETFWKSLLNNYTKSFQQVHSHDLFEMSTFKKQILEAIDMKKKKIELINNETYDWDWAYRESYENMLRLRHAEFYVRDSNKVKEVSRRIEDSSREWEGAKKKLDELFELLNKMKID